MPGYNSKLKIKKKTEQEANINSVSWSKSSYFIILLMMTFGLVM